MDLGTPSVSDIVDKALTVTNDAPVVFPMGDTVVTWTATDASGNGASDTQIVSVTIVQVVIDVKPGSEPNSINPGSNGVIPVAIINDGSIDPADVDPGTVTFGTNEAPAAHFSLEDIDGDGDIDLVLQFRTQETGIQDGDTSVTLRGQTNTGWAIIGEDEIRTVPSEKVNNEPPGQAKDKNK